MEIRKVQITGGASFIISLPKDWARKVNISKNDRVGIIINSDDTLLIIPHAEKRKSKRVKRINVDVFEKTSHIFRILLGAYITGYNLIELISKERISPLVGKTARDFVRNTIGMEIIEETRNHITIKDLLDPLEMPFERAIKRVSSMVKGMHEDAFFSLRRKNVEICRDVIARDDEVDRLQWLMERQYNIISNDRLLAEELGFSGNIANYALMGRIMERIGDHAVKIAENSLEIMEREIGDEILDNMGGAINTALNIFDRSINSFFEKDIEKANENIENMKEFLEICEEINRAISMRESNVAVPLGYIMDSIRRTGEYSVDMSEYVINYLMES